MLKAALPVDRTGSAAFLFSLQGLCYLCFGFQPFADLIFDLSGKFRVIDEEIFYRITALSYFVLAVAEPGTAFIQDAHFNAHINDLSDLTDPFSEDDVEFYLAERRRYFIFNHFYTGAVTGCKFSVFDLGNPANVQAYGGIEFKCVTAGCSFRVTKHNPD